MIQTREQAIEFRIDSGQGATQRERVRPTAPGIPGFAPVRADSAPRVAPPSGESSTRAWAGADSVYVCQKVSRAMRAAERSSGTCRVRVSGTPGVTVSPAQAVTGLWALSVALAGWHRGAVGPALRLPLGVAAIALLIPPTADLFGAVPGYVTVAAGALGVGAFYARRLAFGREVAA